MPILFQNEMSVKKFDKNNAIMCFVKQKDVHLHIGNTKSYR